MSSVLTDDKTQTQPFPTSDQLSDVDYWRQLVPELSIGTHPFRGQQGDYRFPAAHGERLSRQIRKEGYFQSEPVIPSDDVERIARGIAALARARVLPVFIGMYDEFWQILYKLRHTFAPILGELYRLPPDFWAWHVAPNAAHRGWDVHRDAQLDRPFNAEALVHPDGTPRMCTIWIPFTDADTHNSCIYVLPFPHDPAMQSFLRRESVAVMQQHESRINWTGMRALPARAGSVLGWTPYIVHWGSQSTDWATHPRISVGIYYHSANVSRKVSVPFDDDGRRYIDIHDPGFRINFHDRLGIISNILAIYIGSGQMGAEPNFSPAVTEFCRRWKRKT